jgi:hypothetical protein
MSQSSNILAALKAGKHITPLDALRDHGCLRLAARIHDLKEAGHQIVMTRQEVGANRTVAKYSLQKATLPDVN